VEEVEVFIRTDGSVELKVQGAKGRKCEELTRPLEAVLGGGIIERAYTEEYYQVELVENEEVHLEKRRP